MEEKLNNLDENSNAFNKMSFGEVKEKINTKVRELENRIFANNEIFPNTEKRMEANEPLSAKIARLQQLQNELNNLNEQNVLKARENELIARIKSATIQPDKIVFRGIDDTHNPQRELERIANELGITTSELRIDWYDGAMDYDDNVATEFDIVRIGTENELAEVQRRLETLNHDAQNFDDITIGKYENEINSQIADVARQLEALVKKSEENKIYDNTEASAETVALRKKLSDLNIKKKLLTDVYEKLQDEIKENAEVSKDQDKQDEKKTKKRTARKKTEEKTAEESEKKTTKRSTRKKAEDKTTEESEKKATKRTTRKKTVEKLETEPTKNEIEQEEENLEKFKAKLQTDSAELLSNINKVKSRIVVKDEVKEDDVKVDNEIEEDEELKKFKAKLQADSAELLSNINKVKSRIVVKEKIEEKAEEKAEEKPEKKAEEKIEEKPEEKPEEKVEEKAEEKPEEKPEKKAEEKIEEKPEKKAEEKAEENKKDSIYRMGPFKRFFINIIRKIKSWANPDGRIARLCEGIETSIMLKSTPLLEGKVESKKTKRTLDLGKVKDYDDEIKKEIKKEVKKDDFEKAVDHDKAKEKLDFADMMFLQEEITKSMNRKEKTLMTEIFNRQYDIGFKDGDTIDRKSLKKFVEENNIPKVTKQDRLNAALWNTSLEIVEMAKKNEIVVNIGEGRRANARPLSEIYTNLDLKLKTDKIVQETSEKIGDDVKKSKAEKDNDIDFDI